MYEYHTDKLSGEEKKRFIQYVDVWTAVNGDSTLDSFITGFRLGAQFAFDTFVTSKAPYTDYLKDEIQTTIRLCHYSRAGLF